MKKLLAFALFALAVIVYLPALRNDFAYDDVPIVQADPRVTEFQLEPIFTKPYWTTPGLALYRPLVTLSFAVDWALSDGRPAWFHGMNAVWHGLATVAVFLLLLAWFAPVWSALGAAVFAVHPVHVEAVANVVGRSEPMAAAFVFLACAAWAHEWPRARLPRFLLAFALIGLAILSKESALVAPGFLVLIDAATGKWRSLPELPGYLKRTAPELLGLVALLVASLLARDRFAGMLAPTHFDPIIEVVRAPDQRILTALQVWPEFIRLFLFPWTLLADYGPRVLMPAEGLPAAAALGFALVAAAVAGGLVALNRGRGLLGLGLLWVPLAFLPVANFIVPIGVLLAERTLYTPSFVVSLGVAALAATVPRRREVAFGILIVCALFALRTVVRIPDWKTTDTIMMAQLRDRPDSFRAVWHRARMERRAGRALAALQYYARAIELWPYRQRLIIEAAAYAGTQNQTRMAYRLAQHGTERWPESLQLHRLLAANALDLGDTATARSAVRRGLALAPRDSLLNQIQAAIR